MRQRVVKKRTSRRASFFMTYSPSSSLSTLLSPLFILLNLFNVLIRYSRSIGDNCQASVYETAPSL